MSALLALGCGGGDAGSAAGTGDGAGSGPATTERGWMLGNGAMSKHFADTPVNVQSVTEEGDYVRVEASGIPDYEITVTAEDIAALNARPNGVSDFVGGAVAAMAGDTIGFGEYIGYNNPNCSMGYWPPGPECPSNVQHDVSFPKDPEPATRTCWTSLNAMGLWVNGTAIFNWWDAQTYNGDGVWSLVAAEAEIYDLDLCSGHAANGVYHHHNQPNCLAEQLGDTGQGHSPIYGYAADGYPVHGPWMTANTAVQSCWKARDYDDPTSPTGCGAARKRTCVLVNPLDPAEGTTPTEAGPDTDGSYTSLSRNSIDAASGLFYEDYYFDAACAESSGALDASSGHHHDDLGYHYHVSFSFPFTFGPYFHGELHDNAMAACSTEATGGVAGGAGGPPAGGPPRP